MFRFASSSQKLYGAWLLLVIVVCSLLFSVFPTIRLAAYAEEQQHPTSNTGMTMEDSAIYDALVNTEFFHVKYPLISEPGWTISVGVNVLEKEHIADTIQVSVVIFLGAYSLSDDAITNQAGGVHIGRALLMESELSEFELIEFIEAEDGHAFGSSCQLLFSDSVNARLFSTEYSSIIDVAMDDAENNAAEYYASMKEKSY
ncbi:hypothetical protein FACS1894184_16510 [Clostridia bacterium]|nr:hypothetical protein FACS1894184_16510 [Clostridia bacterium]